MNRRTLAFASLAAAVIALPLIAEETSHTGHTMTGQESPATMAFMTANTTMHAAMAIEYSGDPDVDFIRGMIPHHQGAVEMAKVVLAHGTDPEVRKLAEGVIAAQEAEITWMQDWLSAHGG